MSLTERLDEFTSRQGIVSAEWCKLLDGVEKLQEQNKILKEALEFYAENKNWEQRESGSTKFCAIDPVDHYQYIDKWGDVFWISGKRASEALAKVGE